MLTFWDSAHLLVGTRSHYLHWTGEHNNKTFTRLDAMFSSVPYICWLMIREKGVLVKYLFTNAYCLEILVKILKGSQGGQRATYLANPCTKSLGAQAKNHYRPTSSTSVHSQAPESTSVLIMSPIAVTVPCQFASGGSPTRPPHATSSFTPPPSASEPYVPRDNGRSLQNRAISDCTHGTH